MAKTDRQTDKATYWSVTAYNDEILRLEDNTTYPVHVEWVKGGREECPTTGKVHYQGMIKLRTQQRMSYIKSWLPIAHLEVCRNKDALEKYVMKSETAVGDKGTTDNPVKFMRAEEICIALMEVVYDDYRRLDDHKTDDKDYIFWTAVNRLLEKDIRLSGQLMNPTLKSWFRNTKWVWYNKVREQRERVDDSDSVISHAEP